MSNFQKIPGASKVIPRKLNFLIGFFLIACQTPPFDHEWIGYHTKLEKIQYEDSLSWQKTWQKCIEQDQRWEKESWELAKEYKHGIQKMFLAEKNNETHPNSCCENFYFLAGRLLGLSGKPEQARTLFQISIEKMPNNIWGYYGMGLYFLKKDSPFYTEIYFNRCLEIQPNFVPALIGLAKLNEKNNEQKTLEYLKTSIAITPDDGKLHHYLGILLLQTELENAFYHLKKAQELCPQDPSILKDLANAYISNQRFSEAKNTLQQLLPIIREEQQKKIRKIIDQMPND